MLLWKEQTIDKPLVRLAKRRQGMNYECKSWKKHNCFRSYGHWKDRRILWTTLYQLMWQLKWNGKIPWKMHSTKTNTRWNKIRIAPYQRNFNSLKNILQQAHLKPGRFHWLILSELRKTPSFYTNPSRKQQRKCSFICTVGPKSDNDIRKKRNHRRISLVNMGAKIISKILTNWM